MTPVAEYLKQKTEEQMEFHKRQASGESIQSIQERITNEGIQVIGVDYWKYINEGRTSGGMPPVNLIEKWRGEKSRRYGTVLPPAWAIAKKIAREGAPENKEGLKITEQVLQKNKKELDKLVKNYINGRLSINN